jgi:hypothetical protein
MLIPRPDLVSEEVILSEFTANLMIDIEKSGLSKFCADGLMWAVGAKGKEAIGGKLFLTNFRLIFSSHPLNRLNGQTAIPLNIITNLEDKSKFIFKKCRVMTIDNEIDFVIWKVPKFTGLINVARNELNLPMWHAALQNESATLRSGNMQISRFFEGANKAFNMAGSAKEAIELAVNPLEFLKDKFIDEAIEKMIKEPVNRYFA